MTLESLASVFENLQSKYQILIRVFQVLAQSPCNDPKYQILIRVFQGWEPLQHPLHGFLLWKRLLQGNEPHDYGIYIEVEHTSSTYYTQLFTKVILQFLAYAILSPCKALFDLIGNKKLFILLYLI